MKSTQFFTTARDRDRFTKVTFRNTPTPTETWINCFPLLCYLSASKLTFKIVVERKKLKDVDDVAEMAKQLALNQEKER